MKFKKIEISAFRIYDKVENATFDFSLDGGRTADFVSLYAPNGYGKTSFYDAVEWGMTNNIQRFWQKKEITNGAIEALKSQSDSQVKLWRNIHSTQPTYVKILGDGIEPIDRHLKPHGNKKSDADVDVGENIENRTFRNVILSQEWISAFLREIDGTKRYDIFMQNPELKDINSYYKNLKTLLGYCQSNISSINEKIVKEGERISALESENILEKINQQIEILSQKFKQPGLATLTLSTSKEEISRLKNLVTERIISKDNESSIREKIAWLSAAKIGNDDYIGVRLFFELEARLKTIIEDQRYINEILQKFSDLEKKTNEITALNSLLEEKEASKNVVSKIVDQFEEYDRVSAAITLNQDRLIAIRSDINLKSDASSSLEIAETETRSDLNGSLSRVSQLTTSIAGLPERVQLISKIEQEVQTQKQKVGQEKEKVKPLDAQLKGIESEIRALDQELDEINKGRYSKGLIEDQVLASSIDTILANREALVENEAKLTTLSNKIVQQEDLNSQISEFVQQGLEIVNKDRERLSCPLCEQKFQTHAELAQRIANNDALDNQLRELFVERNRLEQELSSLRELIATSAAQLVLYFESKIKDKRSLHLAVSDHLKTLNKSIESLEDNLLVVENDLRELIIQQLGFTNEEYEADLKGKLDAEKKIEENLNDKLKKQTNERNDLGELLVKLRDELKVVEEVTANFTQSEDYKEVLAWYRTNFNNEDVSLEVIQGELLKNETLASEYFNKLSMAREEVKNLTMSLTSFNKQAENQRLLDLTDEKERAEGKMDGFKSLLKDKLDIESQFIDFKTLSATLDLKEQGFNLELLNNKSLIDEYNKIVKYADHINEFLQSENAKLLLEDLATEKKFLEERVNQIISVELAKAKTFLQDKVKEFFYEGLINDLYRKIDPHPDFKEVHFSADFDSETPRLDVFVRDGVNKKVELIPNLYFSTAQINILSLSIFLATALNTPDYNCIFIDDPIQSMDSVNILSTIDLLRSIVLNYNKQIILSTHDITFFNLLKKKMPANSFNSKFLELESVGKVKKAS